MSLSRAEMDALCWRLMRDRERPKRPPTSYADYRYLGERMLRGVDFVDAWEAFRHTFVLYRQASFFAYRPPHWIDIEEQAFLAGAAECYSIQFDLPMPDWIDDPRYVLDELWEPLFCPMPMSEQAIKARIEKAHPSFINRNVVCSERGLIEV